MTTRPPRPARNRAERVTFAVSCLLLSVVVALIVVQLFGASTPPRPDVRRNGPVRMQGGQFFVPVEVANSGDRTATQVQVVATLTTGSEVVAADQVIDFLAGEETEQLEFVFASDPDEGLLDVSIGGFAVP